MKKSNFPPQIEIPDDVVIWRYMDFTKFMSLISKKELFFKRADLFEDPYEGIISKKQKEQIVTNEDPLLVHLGEISLHKYEIDRMRMFINCWHENEHESAAMWKLYLKSEEGVAIQTTVGDLRKALSSDNNLSLNRIKYIDYDKDYTFTNNVYAPFMTKRLSFSHEREIRLLKYDFSMSLEGRMLPSEPSRLTSLSVPINLQTFIIKVYVAPTAQSWFYELVKDVLKDYKLDNIIVTQSNLYNIN